MLQLLSGSTDLLVAICLRCFVCPCTHSVSGTAAPQAEERSLLDDVFMAPKERELNRRLLSTARKALDSVSTS